MRKGERCTEEMREKFRASHRRGLNAGWPKGKPRPAGLKAEHSAFMKRLWQDPAYRAKVIPTLKKNADEYRAKVKGGPLVNRYGLTLVEYRELCSRSCEVCGAPPPNNVDHSHKTGKVRGVLCGSCNRALGIMREDVGLILRLADYVIQIRGFLNDDGSASSAFTSAEEALRK